MANTFSVPCQCGRSIHVTAAAAGTEVVCDCGQQVSVPGLSKLRTQAGQDAYITNAAEKINAEHNAGREPAGTHCLQCGDLGLNCVEIKIQCEKQQMVASGDGGFRDVLWIIFFGWVGLLMLAMRARSLEPAARTQGHNRVVASHFRLCERCQPNPRKTPPPAKIRRLLQTVPTYAELFQQFPQAEIKVLRTHAAKDGSGL